VILVADVAGANSNALLDLDAAQAIIDATPNTSAWGGDTDLQEQALVHATSLLEALAYKGVKLTAGQALQWPRSAVRDPDYGDSTSEEIISTFGGNWTVYLDQTTIPRRMKRACTMLALEILRSPTADIWGIDRTANIASKRTDVLSTQYVATAERRFGLRVYPSVWREVYPLTMASDQLTVERA
jgi:hypothetical protein